MRLVRVKFQGDLYLPHRLETNPRVKQAVGTNDVCARLCHPKHLSFGLILSFLEILWKTLIWKFETDLTAHSPAEIPDRSPFGPMAIVAAIGLLY